MVYTRSADSARPTRQSAGSKATATTKASKAKAARSAPTDLSGINVSDAAMATYKLVQNKIDAQRKAAKEAEDAGKSIRARNRALLDAEGSAAEEEESLPRKKRKAANILSDDEEDMAAGLETIKAIAERRKAESEGSAGEEEADASQHSGIEDEDLHADLDGVDVDDADVDMDLGSPAGELSNEISTRTVDPSATTAQRARSQAAVPRTPQVKAKSTTSSSTTNASKVVEKDFTPRTLRLALASKRHVRTRTIYDEPFPRNNKISRINFAWKTIKEAAQTSDDVEVRQAFKRATANTDIKAKLMKFTLYGRTGLVSSIISKAREKVRTYYGFSGDPELVKKDVEWLLKDSHFVYGGIDLKQRTVDQMKPFGAQLIIDIIEAQWFPSTSRSKLDLETTNRIYEKRDLPLTVVLLVVTAIEHALKEWCTNGRKASQITFSEETAKVSYERHLRHWKFFESQTKTWPAWWRKTVLSQILANHSNFDLNTDDNDFANLDFSALDRLAEEAEQETSQGEEEETSRGEEVDALADGWDAQTARKYRNAVETARAAREARGAREMRKDREVHESQRALVGTSTEASGDGAMPHVQMEAHVVESADTTSRSRAE